MQRHVRGCGQVAGSHIGHWKDFHFNSKQDLKPTLTQTLEVKIKARDQVGGYYNDPCGQWWRLKPGWLTMSLAQSTRRMGLSSAEMGMLGEEQDWMC